MTAKCNLLRSLTKNGTFYMFSEYAENLTKSYVQENQYRVIPNKYAMLDLNYTDKTAQSVGEIFQNYYENACSVYRKSDSSLLSAGKLANELLWKTLYKYNFITIGTKDNYTYIPELHYIGEIKVTPFEEVDGVGYNELWCYVDNSVPAMRYHTTYPENQTVGAEFAGSVDNYISGFDSTTYPTANADLTGKVVNESTGVEYLDYNDSNSMGYTMEDAQELAIIPYILTSNTDGVTTHVVDDTITDEFNINTIIVFFDVYDSNSDILYKDIPMGVYFTGTPNDDTLTNEVVKVIADETIYNQGTSYGLRINTKFVCTPQTTSVSILNVNGYTDEMADKYCALLSSIEDSQTLMETMVTEQTGFNQAIKNHLALFANYRANVPYIRTVGGVSHWFVNGKDMGIANPSEKVNNLIDVDDNNNISLTDVSGEKVWLKYNDFSDIVMTADSIGLESKTLTVVNPSLNSMVFGIDSEGNTNIQGLNVYDAGSGTYQEILSYIRSVIRHDELINIKFLLDGESSEVTYETTDWTEITSIKHDGVAVIYDYLQGGDKISIVKYAGGTNITPLIMNYEYVKNGENSYYKFISYSPLWIPTSETSMNDIIKAQLGLDTAPTVIVQNRLLNLNYIYSPLTNYVEDGLGYIFISFNALNNTIFETDQFPDDTDKYSSDGFDLSSSKQVNYPEGQLKVFTNLPTFEARRGSKGIYMQKN